MRMIKNKLWVRCSKTTLKSASVFFLSISSSEGGVVVSNFKKFYFVFFSAGKTYQIDTKTMENCTTTSYSPFRCPMTTPGTEAKMLLCLKLLVQKRLNWHVRH